MDLQQPSPPPLFQKDTSTAAGATAARFVGQRRQRILQLLRDKGPLALFEIAAILDVGDHHISGRFTELERDGLIKRTGQRRVKPDTGCEAELWAIADDLAAARPDPSALEKLADALGYPRELSIDGSPFDRQALGGFDSFPGIPYLRRGGGETYRVDLIECPACGRPVRPDAPRADGRKPYLCTTCGKTLEPKTLHAPGAPDRLYFLMRTL